MASLTLTDAASRTGQMADKRKNWVKKGDEKAATKGDPMPLMAAAKPARKALSYVNTKKG